ncbi:MAG: hypothetical protein HY302_13005, partial [Opitutae bacterium]|nr:hypothetical protein [Opitutae bacterium]
MEANLIQTRYGLPLTVAVAFHAALLLWSPPTNLGLVTPPEPAVVLRPFPKELIEVFRPPVEKAARAAGAKPAAQKLAPALEEILPARVEHAVFEIPVVERQRPHFVARDKVPEAFGPGEIDGAPDGRGPAVGEGPVDFSRLDRTPRAKVQTAPLYPVALRAA